MTTNEVFPLLNGHSSHMQTLAMQAATAIAEGDPSAVKIIGVQYMEALYASGLMDGMEPGEAFGKILGGPTCDEFTVAALCLAADLIAKSRGGSTQIRYEDLMRTLGPRRL